MNFVVSSTALAKQLQMVMPAIANSPVSLVLGGVLFEINNGILTLTATDIETTITTAINVESTDNGAIVIPANTLIDTLKMLPEQPVAFKVDTKTFAVDLASANGKYKMVGMNPNEFSKLPTPEKDPISIPCAALKRSITKSIFSLANIDLRPAMNGMLLQINNQGMTCVTTDAQKLVRVIRTDVAAKEEYQVIIPKKSLNILKSNLPDQGVIETHFTKNHIYFSFGEVNMICRLVDATYPNYNMVIPAPASNNLIIGRLDFLNAIRRIALYANKSSNQISMKLTGNDLQLTSIDSDMSQEANERMVSDYTGEDMEIAFNHRHLIDVVSNLDCDIINFNLTAASRAATITPTENNADEDILMLVMPIMVNH